MRDPKQPKPEVAPVVKISPEKVEAFAAGADANPNVIIDQQIAKPKPKPKRISWTFKEGEHEQLLRLAKKHKRSMLSLIRYAIDQLDKEPDK